MASQVQTKKFTKFCSYCKAKGLPEADFSSHFVKDAPGPKGKVCCPELLKNECGYCHEIGHTPKFCPKLKARDARRKAAKKRQAVIKTNTVKFHNPFTVLKNAVAHKAEAFPVLGNPGRLMAPQGVWGVAAVNAMSVADLEKLLNEKKAKEACLPSKEETDFVAKQIAISEEIQAEGEAFFESIADAEMAAEKMHSMDTAVWTSAQSPATPTLAPSSGTWADECCDD